MLLESGPGSSKRTGGENGYRLGAPMDLQLVFPISHHFLKPPECLGLYRSSFCFEFFEDATNSFPIVLMIHSSSIPLLWGNKTPSDFSTIYCNFHSTVMRPQLGRGGSFQGQNLAFSVLFFSILRLWGRD